MQNETKNCQNCKKDFAIETNDFLFYEKMKVPAPTWCPECRLIRRFVFMNTWSLYKNKCAKCGEGILSIYSINKLNVVYCMPCWWGDSWDGTEYAMDYDSSRPFLEQVKELELRTPWQTTTNMYTRHVNSPYVNACGPVKNCYMLFWADYCENVFYSSYLNGLKDSLDCYRVNESELCYESVGINKCYRTFFSEECDSCTDTWFSRSCSGLVNCFGCINMRNKIYCIFNEQYTRESYLEKLKEFKLDSREALDKMRNTALEFWNKYPRRFYIGNALNKNVTGDYIYESKNAKDCYMASGVEDSRFVQFMSVPKAKDCYDNTGWGEDSERIYESAVVGFGASNVKFSDECWPNPMNVEYSIYGSACENIFGCVNLKRKKYCILNKEYTKEEYEKLKTKIISDMSENPYVDEKGRIYKYGEFLPIDLSPFAYNESNAQRFFPKTKEEALAQGFKWHEVEEVKYNITKKAENLPDIISETDESVLSEVVECNNCGKAYRFTLGELNLMRRLSLPLPHQCFICRQNLRFTRTNLPKLYSRVCMCDKENHEHSGKCEVEFETSYAPERPEIVYCEKCYQQEVY